MNLRLERLTIGDSPVWQVTVTGEAPIGTWSLSHAESERRLSALRVFPVGFDPGRAALLQAMFEWGASESPHAQQAATFLRNVIDCSTCARRR